jgi:pyruvate dehydrogenase E2 component (dihydrolipoamide acetyltransferase)
VQRSATGWRRISPSFWRAPDNPQIFGDLEADARPVLDLLAARNRTAGPRVTATAVSVQLAAYVLRRVPELNCVLRRGAFHERDSIDIAVIVSLGGGTDLSMIRVERADELTLEQIAERIARRAGGVRRGNDPLLGATKRLIGQAPTWAVRPAVRTVDLLVNDLGIDVPLLGIPREPFGSAIVSSVATFGLSHGYGPLSPVYRVPMFLLVGAVEDRPVVDDGAVVARPTLPLCATFDHRYVDGAQLGRAADAARTYLADPGAFDPVVRPRASISASRGVGAQQLPLERK